MDKFHEQVWQRLSLRAEARADDIAAESMQCGDLLAGRKGLDDDDRAIFEELRDLVANRGQPGTLDFDQSSALVDCIDAILIDNNFMPAFRRHVMRFELRMQCRSHVETSLSGL